ncbi:hypothetical protein OG883_27155 [Streptomyces sp. NBC_01142]|uniref:hypothetical protein n=1 Tax=Streptomyces sp. NBC_01142 TaxID=2975865 RepID=UPI00224D696A|nr:hypothetical protein [Streptomyces sp. NBC_01142]MCX4823491.1 hypothetical protein [Streptomyces sp. NBC_01142]
MLGGLFWVVMSAAAWRVPICCDFGQHAAVVERLRADLLHPTHPMADLPGAGSPYYSPFTVVQGLIAQATSLPGWLVVRLSGPVNLLVLLTGIGRFTRLFTERRWAPVLALAAMVLLWGTAPAWWSGYLGLMSMTGNLPYPSTFAIGVAFHLWAWTGRAAREGAGLWTHAALGVILGLVLLIHPISSAGALLGVAALVAGWQSGWGRAVAARWALTGAAAVAVGVSWPYFDVFSLVGDTLVDGIHRRLYENLPGKLWLAAVCLPALWLRLRRDRRDPLVLMCAAAVLAVAYGRLGGHYTYGRLIGFALIPGQIALAVELSAPGPRPHWRAARRFLAPLAAGAACLGFFTVQAGAVVPRSLDPIGFAQPPRPARYLWAAEHIAVGEVVLTNADAALRTLPAYGPYLVAPKWPDPSLPEADRRARTRDVGLYLSPRTPAPDRARIATRYAVRWLLLTPVQRVPREAVVVAYGPDTGEILARVPVRVPVR